MTVLMVGAGLGVTPHLHALRANGVQHLEVVSTRQSARDRVRSVIPQGGDHDRLEDGIAATHALAGGSRPLAVVASPPSAHLANVQALVAAGFDVLVEKPLAHTLGDAHATLAVARRHGARLFVCFQHRYKEAAARAKALLEDDAVGTVVAGTVNVPWFRPQAYYDEPGRGSLERDGGGVLITQAIHALDLYSYVMPEVVSVAAAHRTVAHRMPTEDLAAGVLLHADGVLGTVLATTACAPGGTESVSVWGTKGRLCIEGTALRVSTQAGDRCVVPPVPVSTGADPTEMAPWYCSMYADIIEARRTGAPTRVDANAVLPTHRVVHALYAAGTRDHWTQVPGDEWKESDED